MVAWWIVNLSCRFSDRCKRSLLLLLELHDAFGDGKVFLGAIFAHNKEASCSLVLRVNSDFKCFEIAKLLFFLLVQLD